MMEAVSGAKGPKGVQGEVGGLLKALGYSEDMVYKFWDALQIDVVDIFSSVFCSHSYFSDKRGSYLILKIG